MKRLSPRIPSYTRPSPCGRGTQIFSAYGIWSEKWEFLGYGYGYTKDDALERWHRRFGNPPASRAFLPGTSKKYQRKFYG